MINEQTMSESVVSILLTDLHSFPGHPFQVRDDDNMAETVESIRQCGVLVPAIVRPRGEGGSEIVSGHRRKRACELAGLSTMPVIVRMIDRDTAIIMMCDSNLQRENILSSEKALAYKMRLEAVKRKAGRPAKNNVSQVETNKRSDEIVAEATGESRAQIQRYVRLNELQPKLLQSSRMVWIPSAVASGNWRNGATSSGHGNGMTRDVGAIWST